MTKKHHAKYIGGLISSVVIGLCSLPTHAETPQYFIDLQTTKQSSDPSVVWTQMGPGMSGNNLLVHWHNTDPNVLFLGPNMDNAYRSEDKGHTYHTILDADGNGFKYKDRGPYNIQSPEFSYQSPNVGFATHDDRATLWKTLDKGKTWQEATDIIDTWEGYRLSDITVDPTNDNVWYIGTGLIYNVNEFGFSNDKPHGFTSSRNRPHEARIWKSSDKGVSWDVITPEGINPDAQITKIIVNPENTNHVYAATTYGFYKSTDAGKHWTLKGSDDFDHNIIRAFNMHHDKTSGEVTLFAIDLVKWKANGTTVENDGGGVFKSTDGGETWSKLNANLDLNVKTLASAFSFKKNYYKAVGEWFGMSTSQAQAAFPDIPTKLMHRLANVIVDPNNVDRVFVFNDYKGKAEYTFQGGIVWKSENGGDSWKVTLRNGKAWDGVHKSYWEGRGNPTSYNINFAGQRKWKQEDPYWRKAGSAFSYNADGSVLMGQIAKVLLASYDHGETWSEIDEVELFENSDIWVAAGNSNMPGHGLIQDKRLPDRTFFATGENDFWVTRPGGETVRKNVQAAERIHMRETGEFSVSSVAFHPNDVNTMYSLQFRQTQRGHLLKSVDGGKSFESHGVPLPEPWPESHWEGLHQLNLTIDPVEPDYMYFNVPKSANELAYVGNSKGLYGIYKSADGGKNWTTIHAGLPTTSKDEDKDGENDIDVAVIRLDPNVSSTIYAGIYSKSGNGGLFKSTNRGDTWTQMELPSGIKSVVDIHFDKNGKFYVSTGSTNAGVDNGGLLVTSAANPDSDDWTKIFHMPFTGAVTTAEYDENIILLAALPGNSVKLKNAGSYLSKDSGATWTKMNTGNGQSDRINDVAIHLTKPDIYYVSTRGAGVLRSFPATPSSSDLSEVIVSVTAKTVSLSWAAIDDTQSYQVWRSDNDSEIGELIADNLQVTNYKDEGLNTGQKYFYTVKALGESSSIESDPIEATPIGFDEELIINAIEDADVKSNGATSNFGSTTQLKIKASPVRNAFIKFNVDNITDEIVKVILRVKNLDSHPLNGSLSAFSSTNDWEQSTVTYNTKNDLLELIATEDAPDENGWFNIDVTNYINANGTYTIGLSTTGNGRLASTETGISNDVPHLHVQTVAKTDSDNDGVEDSMDDFPLDPAYGVLGDFNNDQKVDRTDMSYFIRVLRVPENIRPEFDFNGDGTVNRRDVIHLRTLCTNTNCT